MVPALPAYVLPPLAAVLATGLALYIAPILIAAAQRYGIVDKPRPPLKLHQQPVPYLGGLVVFVAFVLSLALTFPFEPRVLAILLAASLVVSVGLVDDLGTLTPKDKFVGQLIAAVVLVKAGVKIDIAVVPFPVDELASILWLATCMNAFNILDVSDGLATTAGLVGSVGATAIAVANGEPMIATLSAALAGACAGFLWFNRQPARMYLGDTGSMLLGAVLGALAMSGRYSETNTVSAWFVPLALVAAPLFDLVLVVLARLRARRPVYYGSPDHFAVRLKHAGWSARRVAWTSGAVGAAFIGAGVLSTFLGQTEALVVVGATATVGVALLVAVYVRFPAPAARDVSGPVSVAPGATSA